MNIRRICLFGALLPCLLTLVFLSGCGGIAKMVSVSTKLGHEIEQLNRMSMDDVLKNVDGTVKMDRIKSDPEGILGAYVSITGIVDLEGSKNFPLEKQTPGKKKDDGAVFILDDAVFVISTESLPWMKNGDEVVVVGLVSESRFLKEIREMYPKEGIPDLVTVVAKKVQKHEATPVLDEAGDTPKPIH